MNRLLTDQYACVLLFAVVDLWLNHAEGGHQCIFDVFFTKPVRVNENLGVERHQRGVNSPPPTNQAMAVCDTFYQFIFMFLSSSEEAEHRKYNDIEHGWARQVVITIIIIIIIIMNFYSPVSNTRCHSIGHKMRIARIKIRVDSPGRWEGA